MKQYETYKVFKNYKDHYHPNIAALMTIAHAIAGVNEKLEELLKKIEEAQ